MAWFRHERRRRTSKARSLCWQGDDLVDWSDGPLDAAVTDASGRWVVAHERLGTAARLLRDGQLVRELHRSSYQSHAFLYPACLFTGPDGRTLLAHCPDVYCRIEIDDAETGERLTRSDARRPPDFFHSRLVVSPGGKRLLSAGWVWHPLDAVVWFDIAAVLANPALLDALDGPPSARHVCLAEMSSAAWLDDDRAIIGASAEPEDPDEAAEFDRENPGPRLRPNGLAIYDVARVRCDASFELGYPPGTMMPVGRDHVVTFFEHPRLVSLVSGTVVHEWTAIDSGKLVSSIAHYLPASVLALDPARARFAVAAADGIDVVSIDPAALPGA